MSFEELGRMLRQSRERRGLSVEDVAERLKFMPRIVRAIEQADVEGLPQAAYARGFVKAYGNLLELEPEQLHAGMEDAWPEDAYQPPAPYEPAETKQSSGKGRMATFISLLLIAAAVAGFWLARDLELRLPSTVLPRAEPAISVAPSEAEPAVSVAPSEADATIPAKDEVLLPPAQARDAPPPGRTPAPVVAAAPVAPENVPGTAQQAAFSPAAPAAVPDAAPQDKQRNLIIIALAECWVHSSADDTDIRQFSLRKGDTFALTFNRKLVLKLGNAGGVRLRLDGQDLETPGAMGQVKTLTFPANP